MSKERKSRKVAMAGKGQLWFSAGGVDAAIRAYREAILDDWCTATRVRELVHLGDFVREMGLEAVAAEAYREVVTVCMDGGREYACRYWRDAYHCALMLCSIPGNEEGVEMDRVLDFFNSASGRC